MRSEMVQWLATRGGDWLITAVFGIPTLVKFNQASEDGFSWVILSQIIAILAIWLAVIVVITIRQEVKRIQTEGDADEPIVVFAVEGDRPPP